jgi:tetratricopeptide (TPR) repeat protein
MLRDVVSEHVTPISRRLSPEVPGHEVDRGRYQILGEIARGGMGAVLKGRDTDLGRDLAVKVLLDEHRGDPDLTQRFVEEAQINGQLQHPGIVPVYELGCFNDRRPFFTMKLVKGQTLAALLDARSAPNQDQPRFLGVFEAVCQTMAYAHARGVVHRDLKPTNVMVGSFGEVQVMDWGLAKVLHAGGVADERPNAQSQGVDVRTAGSGSSRHASRAGSVLGTPAYMPPEQARGEVNDVNERADVFALGAILCEILTGEPPYPAASHEAARRMAAEGDLTGALARLEASGTDADLIALARRSLAPSAPDRPRDAGEVARAMTTYLAGVQERLRAAEIDRAQAQARAVEEKRRRSIQMRMASAILLVLVAGIAGVATQWGRAETNLRKSRARLKLAEEAIDRFYTGVSQDVLLKEPQLKTLREKLLGSALEFYKKLEAELAAEGAANTVELASAYERVAEITEEAGTFPAALDALERARVIRARLVDKGGDNTESAAALAKGMERRANLLAQSNRAQEALDNLESARAIRLRLTQVRNDTQRRVELARNDLAVGNVLAHGLSRYEDACAPVERAVATCAKLVLSSEPNDRDAPRRALAEALLVLGALLQQLSRSREACVAYDRSADLLEQLVVEHPNELPLREALGRAFTNRGTVATELNESDDAERAYRRARSIQEALVRDQPNVSRYRYHLGHTYGSVGWWFMRTSRVPEAVAAYRKSESLFDDLAKANPTVARYAALHGLALSSLGNALGSVGKPQEGLEKVTAGRNALERVTREDPTNAQYRSWTVSANIYVASFSKQMGRRAQAITAYEHVLDSIHLLPRQGPGDIYNAACAHASLAALNSDDTLASGSKVASHLDLALAELQRAVKAGYRQPGTISLDPDLAPLRSRAEYQLLMLDLNFPKNLFAR